MSKQIRPSLWICEFPEINCWKQFLTSSLPLCPELVSTCFEGFIQFSGLPIEQGEGTLILFALSLRTRVKKGLFWKEYTWKVGFVVGGQIYCGENQLHKTFISASTQRYSLIIVVKHQRWISFREFKNQEGNFDGMWFSVWFAVSSTNL